MEVEETEYDDWSCVPELGRVVKEIEELRPYIYEIKNCVRNSNLGSMVEDMKDMLERALDELNDIDTDVNYITVEEDEI
jgi:hypothetical protein